MTYDTRAVRQALRALGSEPAPTPVNDSRRVVLEGGGNEVAMSLYRAMGRGTSELSEAQIHQRQAKMLEQFEIEAQQVLRMLGAFRTVVSLEDERAARRGLPSPEAETVVMQATGTGEMVHAEAVPVRPGATYRFGGHPVLASEADVGAEEPDAGRWEGTSAAHAVDSRVQRLRRERVAPDMETCTDCGRLVFYVPALGHFLHVDAEDMPAFGLDGHVVHGDKLTHAPSHPQHEQAMAAQQGPAMNTEEKAKEIVKRAVEAARRDIDADRARAAHYDRDSGIEPGYSDTSEFAGLGPKPYAEKPLLGRVRDRLERWRRYLDGYTARELDELEEHQQGRR